MAYLATRQRPTTSAPSDGSRTITLLDSQPREEDDREESSSSHDERDGEYTIGVLRLRGGPSTRGRVRWAGDTVDNEGMGKKKSKICCIYHKPKRFDESSDEDSSSSDSDSDSHSGCDHHDHSHNHGRNRPHQHPTEGGGNEGSTSQRGDAEGSTTTVQDLSDLDINAYEVQPSGKKPSGKKRKQRKRPVAADKPVQL